LEQMGYKDKITVDLGIVNRTDYYTGVVFKGYIAGCGEAALSGGRYDKLLSNFGVDAAAIGFAINVDAVVTTMLSHEKPAIFTPEVLVFACEGYETKALTHLKKISESGQKCENCVFDELEEAKKYAKLKNIKKIDVVAQTITSIVMQE
ncbi:MAG: ATP phosphoribosyltransferase regulatory subunit, partial [Oscillospiraceae bacterium]